MDTSLPYTLSDIRAMLETYPTPFHIYDEARIRQVARTLQSSMDRAGVPNFGNYFAIKALPNPEILEILVSEGMGVDCSSIAELAIAEMVGLSGDQIMFSSNNTSQQEFAYARQLGAIINFDDLTMVEPFVAELGAPEVASCRYNPGDLSFGGINESIIGSPREAKYGMPLADMITAYQRLQAAGVTRFGFHTMLLSNELDWRNHARIVESVFTSVVDISRQTGIQFEFINLGGGIGVPYRPAEHTFDLDGFGRELARLYRAHDLASIGEPRIVMENGRFITADSGSLVTSVINRKHTHKTYIGVDATMSDLMRPGMYDAYHHITVLGRPDDTPSEKVDITGSLCENNDKFAIDRWLPTIETGDILAIHTTGAHGHAMGFQYNGKLRHAELLLRPDGSIAEIRRAETLDDYFGTLTHRGDYHVPTN